jgi:hypothetical protein
VVQPRAERDRGEGGEREDGAGAKIAHGVTSSAIHGLGMSRARRLHGLTLGECAERAGVTVETWQRWEAGDGWPPGPLALWPVFRLGRDALVRLGAAEGEG